MGRLIPVFTFMVAIGTTVCGQNYPPPNQPYSQPYPQQYPQQPPYYGQQPVYGPEAPNFPPQQLDQMVGRIALYPDPLLAQVLTASTFSNAIPDAAGWARAHSYLTGESLARAIQGDALPWDPSVLALLPFPTVLDTLAGDMGWTQQLGNAVLANRGAVMDAVQRQRSLAVNYGYLNNNNQLRVVNGGQGDIEILPANPGAVYVPYYDPYVVYARPRPGFFVGGALSFGPGIGIGAFAPFGWGGTAFGWREHRILVNNRPWERGWGNRESYTHSYGYQRPAFQDRRVEQHELREYRGGERREDRREGGERRR